MSTQLLIQRRKQTKLNKYCSNVWCCKDDICMKIFFKEQEMDLIKVGIVIPSIYVKLLC